MEHRDNSDLAKLFPGEQFLGEPPVRRANVKRFEMSERQLAARYQLEKRGYFLGNTFVDTKGDLIELWMDRTAVGPTALLSFVKNGGWDLFCQPIDSNDIEETWREFDRLIDKAAP